MKIISKTPQDVSGGYQRWLVTYEDGSTEIFSLNLRTGKWSNTLGQSINPDTGEILEEQVANPFNPDFGPPDLQPDSGTDGGTDGGTGEGDSGTDSGTGSDTGGTGTGEKIMAFETFKAYMRLAGIEDDAMAREIYDAGQSFLADGIPASDILDLVAVSGKSTPLFTKFIANFNDIKGTNPEITTIADWMNSRKAYQALLSEFGLNALATYENADQFLKNGVSYNEAADRLNTAYYAIVNADEALKQQLKTYFPSLSTADLVANILGVGKTTQELQKQIGMSGIRAEAATAGLAGKLTAEELYGQGISRERARQGYQEVKAQKPLAEAAAIRAGQSPSDIQTELEKESLLGLRSKRRAQLAAREQAYFAGKSGTANVSLGGSTSGAF